MLASSQPLTLSELVTYTVDLTTSQPTTAVLLDRLVVLPSVFRNATSLIGSDETEQFQSTCDVISNDMKYVFVLIN